MKLKKKKGAILLYTLIFIFILMTSIFFFEQRSSLTKSIVDKWNNQSLANNDSSLEDAILKNIRTNPNDKTKIFEEQSTDSNYLEQTSTDNSNSVNSSTEINDKGWNWLTNQMDLDKFITDKFSDLKLVEEENTANKAKFVQSFTFEPTPENWQSIQNLKISWGLSENTNSILRRVPNLYIIMVKIPKTWIIDFSNLLDLSNTTSVDALKWNYWNWFVNWSIRNFRYISSSDLWSKSNWKASLGEYDRELNLQWDRTFELWDIVSPNGTIQTCTQNTWISWNDNCFSKNSIYKIYLIFSFNSDTENQSVPLKLEAFDSSWNKNYIALNDFIKVDTTAYYKQAKQRIQIIKSVSNDVLPFYWFAVYSKEKLCKERNPSISCN